MAEKRREKSEESERKGRKRKERPMVRTGAVLGSNSTERKVREKKDLGRE